MSTDRRIQPPFGGGMTGFWCIEGFRVNHRILVLMESPPMSKAISRDSIYRRRRFQPEIIELCARWYLTYRLSYRDLVEMMAEPTGRACTFS
jgi:hypothetical protein